ncbi:MAG: hypothetical protein ACJAZS_000291 [Alteromonas naphthalenivorans]|jgi:hypothetical protein
MSHPAYASRVTHFIMGGKNMKKIALIVAFAATSLSAKNEVVEKKQIKPKVTQVAKKEIKKPVLILENEISSVIYTGHDPIILTKNEFERPSINGQEQTREEVIKARKMEYEAVYVYNMPIPDEAINSYIKSLKDAHGMDDKEIKIKFDKAGYAYEEGVDELRRMLVIDSLFGFKIKSRLVVPEDDVRAYYEKNKEELPAAFNIKKGFLAKGILTPDEIVVLKQTGKHSDLVDWMSPYWLAENDMAESLQHMKVLDEGAIVAAVSTGNGHEVIQLIKKRPKRICSFEESYRKIADMLHRPLFEKLVKEYELDLDKKYEVVFC